MKNKLIYLLLFILPRFYSQEQEVYPFMDLNSNHLFFGKDSSSFMRFYQKLDSFSNKTLKRISIVHIGGSHVQGGTWSNSFTQGLQDELKPVGGGYFFFPYKLAKTNSPHFVSSFGNGSWKKCRCVGKDYCLPLGMSGMSVRTNDSVCEFGMALTKKSLIKGFNSARIYHNFNPSFEFRIVVPPEMEAVRLDNKTEGYTQFDLAQCIDSLTFQLTRKDTIQKDFILYGLSAESNMANSLYLATLGANGAQSSSFLKCTYFTEQLRTIHPDLVILSLGVNDSQNKAFEKEDYIEHYDSLITKVREAAPGTAILLTTTTDNFIKRRTPNKRSEITKDAMFELMNKHGVAVWDLFSIMGGYKSMLKWVKAGLASKDRVHFSGKGYTIIGDLMSSALLKSYYVNRKKENK